MRVLMVCLGNICRSPMAEGLLRQKLAVRGLADFVTVDSAGTGGWHAGEPPDRRTVAVLQRAGAPSDMVARQIVDADFHQFDVILAMDRANAVTLRGFAPPGARAAIALLREGLSPDEVPDPYYGGEEGFERVRALIDEALEGWLARWEHEGLLRR